MSDGCETRDRETWTTRGRKFQLGYTSWESVVASQHRNARHLRNRRGIHKINPKTATFAPGIVVLLLFILVPMALPAQTTGRRCRARSATPQARWSRMQKSPSRIWRRINPQTPKQILPVFIARQISRQAITKRPFPRQGSILKSRK